jgi:purine catabolism regulator
VLTVQGLVEEMGLDLVAGRDGAGAPIRWVHATELTDPTPWLSGGELILTTGLQLDSEDKQRELVERLASHHVAGLGFGTGFEHDKIPEPLLEEARAQGFPVFEVPYALPFIAITERAFTSLVNEQYEVLQRSIAIHRRLERLLLEERGLDELTRAIAATIGGAVVVLDPRGEVLASRAFQRELSAEALESIREEVRGRARNRAKGTQFVPDHPDLGARALVLPVLTSRGGPQAWLAAARDSGGLGDAERLTLEQSVTVVALELMRQRAMRDTERRLAGDVLAEALAGELDETELAARLRPFGVGARSAVLVFSVPDPRAAEAELDRAMAAAGHGALVASCHGLLCAVVDGTDLEPIELAGQARDVLAERHPAVRAAASRVLASTALRRSFHEARCALEAIALTAANGAGKGHVASYRDLGSFQLLLSLQDDAALRLFCDSVLDPLENGGGEYGDELLRSLEVFIEQNGQWERAARELYCHRHTLRYRIRRIEELTGRDLASARDRIEFWLALRGRELVG